MNRVYEVGFEAEIDGEWQPNFAHRTVLVSDAALAAIKKAEKLEREAMKDAEEPFAIRAESVKFITDVE